MADLMRGGSVPRAAPSGDEPKADLAPGAAEQDERAIGLLPGVVNDLPEVAPHEWIYLMS